MRKNKSNNCFFGSKNKIFNILTLALMIFPILAQLFVGSATMVRAEGETPTVSTSGTATGTPEGYGNLVTNDKGTLPKWYWQLPNELNVMNPHAPTADGKFIDWNGDPNNTENDYLEYRLDSDNPLTEYKVRKFARQSKEPKTYDVYLNVRGEQKKPRPLDIYLVLDISNSMNRPSSDGKGTKYDKLRSGVIKFLDSIDNDDHLAETTRVGMVLYSDTYKFWGTSMEYLKDPAIGPTARGKSQYEYLKNLLPVENPAGPQTFTQMGLRFASEAMKFYTDDDAPKENKIIALLTDGRPNYLYKLNDPNSYLGEHNSLPSQMGTINNSHLASSRPRIPKPIDYYFGRGFDDPNGYGNRWDTYSASKQTVWYKSDTSKSAVFDFWDATISEAKSIQKDYTVFGLGIDVYRNGGTSSADQTMTKNFQDLASPNRFGFAETGDEVEEYLSTLFEKIKNSLKSVEGAKLVDPIGDMFTKVSNPEIKFIAHEYEDEDGNKVTPEVGNILNDIKYPIGNQINDAKNITLDNITLGKGEEIQVHYKVKFNSNINGFDNGNWYPLNKKTLIYPKYNFDLVGSDVGLRESEFFVPSARYVKPKVVFKKVWTNYFGTPLKEEEIAKQAPGSLNIKLSKKVGNSSPSFYSQVTVSKNSDPNKNWIATLENQDAPETDSNGAKYEYSVEESVSGYQDVDKFNEFEQSDLKREYDQFTNTTTFTVYNRKKTPDFEPKLNVTKVGAYGDKLAGADFKLTENNSNNQNGFVDTDADKAIFNYTGMLLDKSYNLEEIDAPDGYIKLKNPISIKFVQKDGKLFAQITAKPFEKALIKELKDAKSIAKDTFEIEIPKSTDVSKKDTLNLTVENNLQADLPLTGGKGSQRQIVFVLIPLLMLTIGTSFYQFYLKKRS